MTILYHREDHAALEVDREGNHVLHVVCRGEGDGPPHVSIVLDDEELERYREWGEHFIDATVLKVRRDPGAFRERNLRAVPAGKVLAGRVEAAGSPRGLRIVGYSVPAVALLFLVGVAVDRPAVPVKRVRGKVVAVHAVPEEDGERLIATVLLEGGATVRVPVRSRTGIGEGAAVTVGESRSRFLGARSYRIEEIGDARPVPGRPVSEVVR